MREIHPSAVIDPQAELADDVTVGAYCIIRGNVRIGPGCVIDAHSHIHGQAIIGQGCKIGPAAYVGLAPQDLKYSGEPTWVIIGDHVVIRETASVHRSTRPGLEHATRVGERCFLMGGSHVAHDCILGNDVVMANDALLAGHCQVGNRAFLGGGFTLHQFCRIGRLAMVAGNEALSQDVPPFAAVRYRALRGYNAVGCRRAGFSAQTSSAIRRAYQCLRKNRIMSAAVEAIKESVPDLPEVRELLQFIAVSRRGIAPSAIPSTAQRLLPGGGALQESENFAN
jgi:UDP-N-acetylglucosamine acyltransferase